MEYKELHDEQFIELIKSSGYFDNLTKFNKILVRNTLDHYQVKPLHTTRIITKEDFLPIDPNFRTAIEDVDIRAEREIKELLENEISLYNKIKEYKSFFGLDITKNVMVTIEYDRNVIFTDCKHVITYIV